jgi:hypothetical protein
MHPGLTDELIEGLAVAAPAWPTADAAVAAIAAQLPEALEISRIGLRTHTKNAHAVEVVGVWSRRPTVGRPVLLLPEAGSTWESYEAISRLGRAQIRRFPEQDAFLYEKMLADEGSRSFIQVPIKRGDEVKAVLAIMSARSDAFSDDELLFYERLGDAVAESLIELAARSIVE